MSHSLLTSLKAKEELTASQISEFSEILLDEAVPDLEKASLLKLLTTKEETAMEITHFVNCFLKKARRPDFSALTKGSPTIDVCGTGGDKLDLFNVSTTSMFVLAAGGAKVIKHGNRGITSQSGSSDVLSELGIPLQPSDEELGKALDESNLCFLFAPAFHPAFKAVVGVRGLLAAEGIRTVFNLLGPLLNPASPDYQMVGVSMPERTADFAQILKNLGRKKVYAITGHTADGSPVDECSTLGGNTIYTSTQEQDVTKYSLSTPELGLPVANLADLKGGDAVENAQILQDILAGKEQGAKRDIVLLNAGAGLACCEIVPTISEGVTLATELIDSGKALHHLKALQDCFK